MITWLRCVNCGWEHEIAAMVNECGNCGLWASLHVISDRDGESPRTLEKSAARRAHAYYFAAHASYRGIPS
jgi:hypothetical protein